MGFYKPTYTNLQLLRLQRRILRWEMDDQLINSSRGLSRSFPTTFIHFSQASRCSGPMAAEAWRSDLLAISGGFLLADLIGDLIDML